MTVQQTAGADPVHATSPNMQTFVQAIASQLVTAADRAYVPEALAVDLRSRLKLRSLRQDSFLLHLRASIWHPCRIIGGGSPGPPRYGTWHALRISKPKRNHADFLASNSAAE